LKSSTKAKILGFLAQGALLGPLTYFCIEDERFMPVERPDPAGHVYTPRNSPKNLCYLVSAPVSPDNINREYACIEGDENGVYSATAVSDPRTMDNAFTLVTIDDSKPEAEGHYSALPHNYRSDSWKAERLWEYFRDLDKRSYARTFRKKKMSIH